MLFNLMHLLFYELDVQKYNCNLLTLHEGMMGMIGIHVKSLLF